MKTAFLIPSLRAGGAERVFAHLAGAWGEEVHLIVLRREGPYFEFLPPSVVVHELGGRRFGAAIPRLLRLVAELRPDALLVTQAHMNAAAGWLRPWLKAGKVVGRETSMPAQADKAKKNSPFRRWVYRVGYRRLDTVICLSRAMAEEVGERYGVASRIVVVPNPVEFGGRTEDRVLPAGRWIAAVGRFERVKGFDLLLEALVLLPEFRLALIGDGRLRGELEAQAARLGVSDRVLFAGFQEKPARYLAGCEAFVLSSRYEGMPNAALEALGMGIPVAAFDGPWGVEEVVVEGVTGRIARAGDTADLARAVRAVAEESWDRDAIRSWARQRFEISSVVARYREALR